MSVMRLASLLLLVAAFPAWAQEAIGYVKTVSGDAMVIDQGKPIKALVCTPIKLGNGLKTGWPRG